MQLHFMLSILVVLLFLSACAAGRYSDVMIVSSDSENRPENCLAFGVMQDVVKSYNENGVELEDISYSAYTKHWRNEVVATSGEQRAATIMAGGYKDVSRELFELAGRDQDFFIDAAAQNYGLCYLIRRNEIEALEEGQSNG